MAERKLKDEAYGGSHVALPRKGKPDPVAQRSRLRHAAPHVGQGERAHQHLAFIVEDEIGVGHVLVDVAPLLPSADAELLIDLIGQVFLVVEAGGASKGDVARCRAVLEKLDPRAVGLIVNRVTLDFAGAHAREYVVENITGGRAERFLNVSQVRLWLQLQHAAWSRRRMAAQR